MPLHPKSKEKSHSPFRFFQCSLSSSGAGDAPVWVFVSVILSSCDHLFGLISFLYFYIVKAIVDGSCSFLLQCCYYIIAICFQKMEEPPCLRKLARTQIENTLSTPALLRESFSPIMAGITYPDPAYPRSWFIADPVCVWIRFKRLWTYRAKRQYPHQMPEMLYILTAGTYFTTTTIQTKLIPGPRSVQCQRQSGTASSLRLRLRRCHPWSPLP